MTDLTAVLAKADGEFEQSLERLFALVRIPSISTDPAYATHCQETAEAIVKDLSSMGFKAAVRKTPGRPMVVAHFTPKDSAAKAPHL